MPACDMSRALDIEKKEADRLGTMLEDSRRERDAEVSRMQQNIDSLREQLEVGEVAGIHFSFWICCAIFVFGFLALC